MQPSSSSSFPCYLYHNNNLDLFAVDNVEHHVSERCVILARWHSIFERDGVRVHLKIKVEVLLESQ